MNVKINYSKGGGLYVIKKIKNLIKFAKEGDLLMYKINFFNKNKYSKKIKPIKEDQILHDLQDNRQVLKIDSKEKEDDQLVYYLTIFPKFEKTFIARKYLRIVTNSDKRKTKPKHIKQKTLWLNADGDLWYEPKKKYCYSLSGGRHKIFHYLATHKGYQQTRQISSEVGMGTKRVSDSIGKMKKIARKKLKIIGKELLKGRKGSGYKIGEKFKIMIV